MFRSMMLVCAIGALGAVGCVATSDADEAAASQDVSSHNGGGFDCQNKASITGVECIGSIAVLPITVDVHDVGVLDQSKLDVLSGDLNNLSIKDINILDKNTILNDVKTTVLEDFLNKFLINVDKNQVNVCTLLNVCL